MLGCVLLIAGCASTAPSAGIRQIIETRDGRRGVWGVEVTLSDCRFNETVREDQITVVEEKYSRDLKELMTWSVDAHRHVLRIVFKPGDGDFGSGDDLHIRINRSAVTGEHGGHDIFEWTIPTDPM